MSNTRPEPSKNRWFKVTKKRNGNIDVSESTMTPSKDAHVDWLHAGSNERIDDTSVDTSNAGKWMVYVDENNIDAYWDKIKCKVRDGTLWSAKVILSNEPSQKGKYALLVDVYNCDDGNEVDHTYQTLLAEKIVKPTEIIKFKSDKQTAKQQYGDDAYLYTSNNYKSYYLLIEALNDYVTTRTEEQDSSTSMFNSFFGRLTGMSADLKIGAAKKMIHSLKNPGEKIEFSHDELVALHNDRLGDIIEQYKSLLPQQYHYSVKMDSYNLSRRTW